MQLAALTREAGASCLLVSHDLAFVSNLADQVIVLYLGTVLERGPAQRLMTRPRHPYTAALLGASPQGYLAGEASPRYRLRGELPSPLRPPSGCQFRTRCPFAEARCAEERPLLRPADGDGMVACHFSERLAVPIRQIAQGLDPETPVARPSSPLPPHTSRTDFQ
ncbi:oligopeptide/dipeptide ABC transporter ATP-binding protein [Cupriavidus sp. NPDC089707]|uniref:oligopeptide/dipeptide ABC transporter ATP-binding protein n=1 Tax=Cupriavidus sp. NPDC089707 TaxID=3363963 RepID=UPI0037F80529